MSEQTAEEFVRDLDAAKKEIEKLQQSNVSKVQALAGMGKGIDPGALANIKIDVFIQSFLDEQAQLVYVRNLEVKIREILDAALSEVRQQQLVQGTPGTGLIIPR
jgi:hypothetical protein